MRYTTNNNTAVCSFTLAVSRQKRDEVDFIPIVAWDKQAEFCSKYLSKGRQIAVVGRLQIRSWDDNEGKKRYTTEVVINECHFADSKQQGQQEQQNHGDAYEGQDSDDELPF
jgi:single-strand DNA-binding protein